VLSQSFLYLLQNLIFYKLVLACGIENALLTVAELEKCEYQITGTTPALCRPLEDEQPKDEL
jgi:protein kinase C substrate 80K-H